MTVYITEQDRLCSRFLLVVWLLSDILVLVFGWDDDAWQFLTNQVWMFGVIAKLYTLYVLVRRESGILSLTTSDTVACTLFLLLGALQLGVVIAFFVLLALDSSILDTMLQNQEHTLAEIILGNHARHVLPVFIHFLIALSIRFYLSAVVNSVTQCTDDDSRGVLGRAWFALLLLLAPSAIGITHSMIFNDQQLYKFGSTEIGSTCQLAFGLTAVLGSIYYLYVLILPPNLLTDYIPDLENKPQPIKAQAASIDKCYRPAAGAETVSLKGNLI